MDALSALSESASNRSGPHGLLAVCIRSNAVQTVRNLRARGCRNPATRS